MAAPARRSDWDLLLGMLAPAGGEKILDIGAGKGAITSRIQQASGGAEVYAVDPDGGRIATIRREFNAIKASVAGAESLPFPDNFFDKVYTTMALHHYADLDRALMEIARVLRLGGSFVVLEVSPNSMKGRMFRLFGALVREHMALVSEDQLAAKLAAAPGFKVVERARSGSSYFIRLVRQ